VKQKLAFFPVFLLCLLFWVSIKAEAQVSQFGQLLGEPQISGFGLLLAQEPTPTPTPEARSTPQVLGVEVEKQSGPKSLAVAVLGDSMIDVLQSDLPQLQTALKNYFPNTNLSLYNFGVGASNLGHALYRLTNEYEYLGRNFPSVVSIQPDILVLESFAYNNFGDSQEGLDKQWLLIAEIITKVEQLSPKTKIILAATIAPNSSVYGDGIDGIDWPPDQKRARVLTVKKYLQNLINFATSQGYSLADAYHPSMDANGEGKLTYINAGDNLHPSGPGGVLFCQKIAEVIRKLW